jgi:ABC-2 type transport system permease protein
MDSADRAVVGLAVRSVRAGAALVAVAVGVVFYLGLTGSSAENMVDVSQVRVIAENPAVRALYGPTLEVASPGAFIVWRYGQFVTLFTAVWVLLATTRLLRGDEEVGRWDLLLATTLDRRRLMVLVLAVLAGTCALVAAALLVAFLAAGEALGGSVLFSAGVGLTLLAVVGLGAVASQVFAQRRRASGLAGAVLGAWFVLRMLADGAAGLGGLRWLTPFGWLEQLAPFARGWIAPLGLLAGLAALLAGLAVLLAARRDLGDGLVTESGRAVARLALLQDPLGIAWRARLGGLVGWSAAVGALGLAVGGITDAFADFIATHLGFREVAAEYGFAALVSAEGFVGTMAAFTGVVLACYAVVTVRSVWEDEVAGRLDLVYAAPVTRTRWLGAGVVAGGVAVLLVSLVAVATTAAGIAAGGGAVTPAATAAGVLNTLPVVALFFGVAVLAHGIRPEQATAIAGGAAAATYLVSFIGPALDWPAWVRWLSPFDHLAVVPSEPVDWGTAAVLLLLAAACVAGGFLGYARRDLR